MADRFLIGTSDGQVAEPIPVETDKEGKLTAQSVDAINGTLAAVIAAINGGICFGDGTQSAQAGNIRGQSITVTSPPVADTEFEVPHGLKRVPIGRLILDQDKQGQLYASNRGGWGVTRVFFKCNQAAVTFFIVLV
jgi:hypothetical protein